MCSTEIIAYIMNGYARLKAVIKQKVDCTNGVNDTGRPDFQLSAHKGNCPLASKLFDHFTRKLLIIFIQILLAEPLYQFQ